MLDVSFLNKNLFRKYPLRSTSTYISKQGVEIPLTLIGGLSISTELGKHTLYISKIVVNGNYINVTVSCSSPAITIGYFSATITEDFQSVPMTATQDYAAGHIVFGFMNSLELIQGSHTFDLADMRIEDSTIACLQRPPLLYIEADGKKITGEVTLAFDNIKDESVDSAIRELRIIDMNAVMSRNDASSDRQSCPTNMIGSLNGVKPTSGGNIDIYGILPVIIDVTATGIKVTTPGIGFGEICTNVKENIPPIPAGTESEKNTYIDDILTTDTEEWKTWPQYNA